MIKNRKICLITIIVLTLSFFPIVSALVVVPEAGLNLTYENGSYINLPAGIYTSINRIGNIWYVNGVEYIGTLTEPTVIPNEWNPTITFAYLGLILLILISLYFAIRPMSWVNVTIGIFLLSYTLILLSTYSEIHWVFALFALTTGIITIIRSTNWRN